MERNVLWTRWSQPGLEHLRLLQHSNGIIANGLVIGIAENVPFRVRYNIRCDAAWRVREVSIELLDGNISGINLSTDGDGFWTTDSGEPFPSLDGCIDVDISVTPFPNTLAIRRLGLAIGASSELTVAYIKVPEMRITPVRQRYTCLAMSASGGQYRYESFLSNFTAELEVDRDGLVIDYPEVFQRVWSSEESATE